MNTTDTKMLPSSRLMREAKTIEVMIGMYCRAHHQNSGLCQQCNELLVYSKKRLHHCVFQAEKPVCGSCTIHCYKKSKQDAIRKVMRYAGPRMMYKHPIMALQHLLDKQRKTPPIAREKSSASGKGPDKNISPTTDTDCKGGT